MEDRNTAEYGDLKKLNWKTLSDKRAANVEPNQSLYRVALILTGACNFACPYCNVLGGARAPTIKRENALELIETLARLGLKELRISGGEPTLVPWLGELARKARDCGMHVALSTNGFEKPELYRDLLASGVMEYSVSLDSADPKTADLQSGNQTGVLERVSQTIRILSEAGADVYIGLTCGKEKSKEELQSVVELAQSLGAYEIKIMSISQEASLVDVSWVTPELKNQYPLLAWRSENYKQGRDVRGLQEGDCPKCAIVWDDATIAGNKHYPCNIYFREKGAAIGEVGPQMLAQRAAWYTNHDSLNDPICKKHCMDILREYNNRVDSINRWSAQNKPLDQEEGPCKACQNGKGRSVLKHSNDHNGEERGI